MTKQEQIEEIKRDIKKALEFDCSKDKCKTCKHKNEDNCEIPLITDYLIEQGYRKLPEDSVVLSREEYEMLKSLYDTQKGAIMTSSIGDLPLTVEGLRKAVDEITRLNRVETELQELNAKYYNEAKDLRRELKQTRKETAGKIFGDLWNNFVEYSSYAMDYTQHLGEYDHNINITVSDVIDDIICIAKNYGVDLEVEE